MRNRMFHFFFTATILMFSCSCFANKLENQQAGKIIENIVKIYPTEKPRIQLNVKYPSPDFSIKSSTWTLIKFQNNNKQQNNSMQIVYIYFNFFENEADAKKAFKLVSITAVDVPQKFHIGDESKFLLGGIFVRAKNFLLDIYMIPSKNLNKEYDSKEFEIAQKILEGIVR